MPEWCVEYRNGAKNNRMVEKNTRMKKKKSVRELEKGKSLQKQMFDREGRKRTEIKEERNTGSKGKR